MDRTLAHDLRNSMMVIKNLSLLIEQDKIKGKDREQAFAVIKAECDKILKMCEK